MPTSMTQVEDFERGKTLLRVEGSLMREDAVLLEKIVLDMREQLDKNITLDLADLDFLEIANPPQFSNASSANMALNLKVSNFSCKKR